MNRKVHGRFYRLDLKGNNCLGDLKKTHHGYARFGDGRH